MKSLTFFSKTETFCHSRELSVLIVHNHFNLIFNRDYIIIYYQISIRKGEVGCAVSKLGVQNQAYFILTSYKLHNTTDNIVHVLDKAIYSHFFSPFRSILNQVMAFRGF